jgi:CHAD domain-containing protein
VNPPTSSPLQLHLADSLHQARRRYRKRLERCQKEFSEKSVHDLRVATRRLLALLDLLKALKCSQISDKPAKNLKKRLDQFGELRDAQVQLELLEPLWTRFPEADGLKAILQRREKKLTTRLSGKIGSAKTTQLSHRLKAIEKCVRKCRLGGRPVLDDVTPALQGAFQRVLNLRQQVQPGNVASVHRLRIAFKRFRYLNEWLQPVLPQITDRHLERMKEYQSLAGAVQDLEVLLIRLARTVRDRKMNPLALRELRNELLQRKRQALDSFMTRIDDLLKFQPNARRLVARQPKAHS